MSTAVYLIGHGRVDAAAPATEIPSKITMHWLSRQGDVTGGLSNKLLSGTLKQVHSTDPPGTFIKQHYLCYDMGFLNEIKVRDFLNRKTPHPHGSNDAFVLYTRECNKVRCDVPLSSIFAYLSMLSSENDWQVYWTCCRGFIGRKNPYKAIFRGGQIVRERREEPGPTPAVGEQGHTIAEADQDTVVLVASNAARSDVKSPSAAIKTVHTF
jgi:hypothetical protein